MKHSFFQAAVVLILLYGCTTWTLTKCMEKKLDGNYTRMLRAILSAGDSTQQSSSYTATYHPSQKLSKLDEPDTQYTAGEVGKNLWVMYSCGPLLINEKRQDIQLEPTYNSSVPVQYVAWRICLKQWIIGRCGKRRSGISVLIARHDDDH